MLKSLFCSITIVFGLVASPAFAVDKDCEHGFVAIEYRDGEISFGYKRWGRTIYLKPNEDPIERVEAFSTYVRDGDLKKENLPIILDLYKSASDFSASMGEILYRGSDDKIRNIVGMYYDDSRVFPTMIYKTSPEEKGVNDLKTSGELADFMIFLSNILDRLQAITKRSRAKKHTYNCV